VKNLIAGHKALAIGTTFVAVLIGAVLIIRWYTQPPAREPIPLGFTWIGDDGKEVSGYTIEETNLRVTYTTNLTIVENEEAGGDPWMIYGGSWYYRTAPGSLFKVVVVSGREVTSTFDNIMSVSSDSQFCDESLGPCRFGDLYLLTVNLEPIVVATSARQYVVINP